MNKSVELNEGDPAPDFSLPSSRGDDVKLSSLRGKKIVLYFYPEDDTPGCTREACSFRDNLPKFDKLDAVILGVSKDSLASHDKFIRKYGRTYWGTERSTFVIDPEGRIRKIFRKVRVDGHDQEVLEALRD